MSGLTRFLGEHAASGLDSLLVLSFIVGLVLSPRLTSAPPTSLWWVKRTILHIYDMGFAFFTDLLDYLIGRRPRRRAALPPRTPVPGSAAGAAPSDRRQIRASSVPLS